MSSEEKKKVGFDEIKIAAQHAVYWSNQNITAKEKMEKVEKVLRDILGRYYEDGKRYRQLQRDEKI